MGDLVGRFPAEGVDPAELEECRFAVQEAHDYLARKGGEAMRRAFDVGGARYWGSEVKRIRVLLLPYDEQRPRLVYSNTEEHNLVEVMN